MGGKSGNGVATDGVGGGSPTVPRYPETVPTHFLPDPETSMVGPSRVPKTLSLTVDPTRGRFRTKNLSESRMSPLSRGPEGRRILRFVPGPERRWEDQTIDPLCVALVRNSRCVPSRLRDLNFLDTRDLTVSHRVPHTDTGGGRDRWTPLCRP